MLRHRADEPDPLIRSVTFFADVHICLVLAEELKARRRPWWAVGDETGSKWGSVSGFYTGFSSFPSAGPAEFGFLAAVTYRGRVVTAGAYSLLTEPAERTPNSPWDITRGGVELPLERVE